MNSYRFLLISALIATAAVVHAATVHPGTPPDSAVAPIPVPVASSSPEVLEAELIAATNRDRREHGLPALQPDPCLTGAAHEWANRLAGETSLVHRSEAGLSLADEVDARCPGRWFIVGENLGTGPSIGAIQGGFMASPAHRANVLSAEYTHIGVAVTRRPDRPDELLVVVQPAGVRVHSD